MVALAICADGTKVPVGLWLGDTENKTVVTNLLADLSARGLDATDGILFVLDGSKALAAGVRKVFGDHALLQRCTLHKRRNVDRPPRPGTSAAGSTAKLARAFNHPDPAAGLRASDRSSPSSSTTSTPTPPRACAKASMTCSPSDVSDCPIGCAAR